MMKTRIDNETVAFAAEMLKTLGHPVRLRIVEYLEERGEAAVHEIQDEVQAPQPVVSQHLNKMRVLGLLSARRNGGTMLYSIARPQVLTLLGCVRSCHR